MKFSRELGVPAIQPEEDEANSETVTEKDSVTILWDMRIHTDRTIAANRPDIVLKNKKEKTCLLIEVTIPPRHQHLSQNHGKA